VVYVSRMADVSSAAPSPRRLGTKPQRTPRRALSGRAVAAERRATIEDWLHIPEEKRAERTPEKEASPPPPPRVNAPAVRCVAAEGAVHAD